MIIKQLKRVFHSELSAIYPETEIDSFFYMLSEAYLDMKRVDIALNINEPIDDTLFHKALNGLKKQKPIQYILGKTEFYGLEFTVNENTLIPRPETEELVDWVITDAKNSKSELQILDIGTGSGCIAISLAKNLPNTSITAFDISKKALKIAEINSTTNGVTVDFKVQNILDAKNAIIKSKFDIIVSNPPYVRELEKKEIQANVLENEPHLALFVSDENPLLFYNAIADFALDNLTKNGFLYFEINQYLGKETISLLKNKGFKKIELRKDIFDSDRMIKCQL